MNRDGSTYSLSGNFLKYVSLGCRTIGYMHGRWFGWGLKIELLVYFCLFVCFVFVFYNHACVCVESGGGGRV